MLVERTLKFKICRRKRIRIKFSSDVIYPGCQRGFFFLVGGDRIERRSCEGESRSGEKKTRRQALLALTLLVAGEREDLWHPG